jgi:hypothetical protein
VGLLSVFHLLLVPAGLGRDVLAAVQLPGLGPGRVEGLVRQGGRVGPHVGDEAGLVEVLGHPHGPGRGEAKLAAGLLLQRRGHERGGRRPPPRLLLHRAHGERGPVEAAHQRPGRRLVEPHDVGPADLAAGVEVLPGDQAATVEADRGRLESHLVPFAHRFERPGQVPVGPGDESHPGPFPLDEQAGGHRLHPAGRQGRHHLLPQHRADLVAVEAVEDATGLLGVDQAAVEVTRLPHGPLDGRTGDLVEDHPLDRDLGGQHLEQVPGDGLPLAVLIGGQIELAGVLEEGLELTDLVLLLPGHHVEGLEVVVHVDAETGPGLALVGRGDVRCVARQVADVADGGLHGELTAEETGDGLRLGGRLDDDEGLGHGVGERSPSGERCLGNGTGPPETHTFGCATPLVNTPPAPSAGPRRPPRAARTLRWAGGRECRTRGRPGRRPRSPTAGRGPGTGCGRRSPPPRQPDRRPADGPRQPTGR